MTLIFRNLSKEVDSDLHLHNIHILVYYAFPGNPPNWSSLPKIFFNLYLEMVLKVMAWAILGSYSVFLGLSYVKRKCACYKILFIFLLLICLLIQKGLNQELRRVEEKLFSLSHQTFCYLVLDMLILPHRPLKLS